MMRQAIAPMEIRGGSDGPIRQYGDCHLQAGPMAEADPAQAPSGLGLLLHSEAFALRAGRVLQYGLAVAVRLARRAPSAGRRRMAAVRTAGISAMAQ